MQFFTDIEKSILKTHMEAQKIPNSQSNSEQKRNAGDITIPDFKLYYRAIVTKQHGTHTKTGMYIHGIEDP
jgi:hypothetical protein